MIRPLLIILVGTILCYPLWTPRQIIYSKHSDIIAQHLSLKAVGQRAIHEEGSLALWDPSMNGGAPALANPQSMYLFPFDLLYLMFPLEMATNLIVLLNVLLAGLAMYLLGSQVFSRSAAALFCALAYMLSYRYFSLIYAGWLNVLSMYALTPLLFWGYRTLTRRLTVAHLAIFAAIIALCFLQGGIQQLYYAGLALAVYAMVQWRQIPRPNRLRAFTYLIIAGLLGLMLSAPAHLPRLEYVSLSTRVDTDYSFFLDQVPKLSDLRTFCDPADEGGDRDEFWENNFYFGFWMLPLWVCAVVGGSRRALLLTAAAFFMLLLCFDSVVLKGFFEYMPGFGMFRRSTRLLLLIQFALVLLAGSGVAAIGSNAVAKKLVISIATLTTIVVGILAVGPRPGATFLVLSGLLVAMAMMCWFRRSSTAVVGLLCILPLVDWSMRVAPLISTEPIEQAFAHHAVHDVVGRTATDGRVIAIGGRSVPNGRMTIPYGMAGFYDINMINGFSSTTLKHYIEYLEVLRFGTRHATPKRPVIWTDVNFRQIARPDLLAALDARYAVANESLPLHELGYERIDRFERAPVFALYWGRIPVPIELWRLTKPLGAAYFATSIKPVEDVKQSLVALDEAVAVTDANVLDLDRDICAIGYRGGRVRLAYRGINRYEYEVESAGDNYLIFSQIWYPGWAATVDGQPTRVYRTNHALIGCLVPGGKHRLVLQMTSPMLGYGVVLAIAAGIVIVALMIKTVISIGRRPGRVKAPNLPS